MANKTLGVLGGMGPAATSVFFERIIARTEAHQDQDHLNMVIFNHAALPDRTQCIEAGDGARFLEAVEEDLKKFECLGVDYIAIPCNTSHFFYEELCRMTAVPIINMITETVDEIYKRCGKGCKVGVLATNGALKSQVYKKACDAKGLVMVVPNTEEQPVVMDAIYQTKAGEEVDLERLESVMRRLISQEACQVIILACTELSILPIEESLKAYCLDAMDVLVEKSIQFCGKELKIEDR